MEGSKNPLVLGLSDRMSDAKTVWLFRERLTQTEVIDGLFNRFGATLWNAGCPPMSGLILDATLVAALKQRNANACCIEPIRPQRSRLTQPIAQRLMKISLKSRALSGKSIGKICVSSLCPDISRNRMLENQ